MFFGGRKLIMSLTHSVLSRRNKVHLVETRRRVYARCPFTVSNLMMPTRIILAAYRVVVTNTEYRRRTLRGAGKRRAISACLAQWITPHFDGGDEQRDSCSSALIASDCVVRTISAMYAHLRGVQFNNASSS